MRVCLIGNVRASHLRRWAGAFRDAGFDTHVLSIRAGDIPGVDVHTVCVGRPNSTSPVATALSYLWLAVRARRVLKAIAPDVVHAHYVTTSGVIAGLAGVHPLVLSAWGSDVIAKDGDRYPWWKRLMIGYALDRADEVTSTSAYMADWIHRVRPDLTLHLTPFGVDTESFTPDAGPGPADPSGFTVGIAKSLESKYGHTHLLEAFAQVSVVVPDARLRIAGGGRLRPALEAQVRDLGLSDRVEFLGPLAHDDVPAFLTSVDVVVNATVVPESFGVVILEASACGRPVVSTDVGGVRETCVDGETAVLVAPADPDALARALVDLAADPDGRARMGRAGRAFVEAHYRWDDSVDTMIDVLRRAVGR